MNDLGITHDLNSWAVHHDGFEDPISAYASASEALFLLLLVTLAVVVWGRMRALARRAAIAAAASAGVALLIGQVLSRLVDRPRPFVAHPGLIHLFAPHAADASFPSDHTTAAFAIATAILLRNRLWGALTMAAAVLLGVSRVVIGVHYPLDVIAGAALGAGVAVALYLARSAPAHRPDRGRARRRHRRRPAARPRAGAPEPLSGRRSRPALRRAFRRPFSDAQRRGADGAPGKHHHASEQAAVADGDGEARDLAGRARRGAPAHQREGEQPGAHGAGGNQHQNLS